MGSLAGKSPANTYKSLLKVADETNGVSGTASQIEDGEGTSTCISVGDDNFKVKPQSDNTTTTFEVENASGSNLLTCLLYTSPSPRDGLLSRMPSSA